MAVSRIAGLRSPRAATVLVVLIAAALVALAAETPVGAPAGHVTTRTTPRGNPAPRRLGRTAAGESVAFDVVLRFPRQTDFDRFVQLVNDPASRDYRHYLTAVQVGARFGPSPNDVGRVATWLRTKGLSRFETYPQRTAIRVEGSAAVVDKALGVTLVDYQDPVSLRRFHHADATPRIPRDLGAVVAGIEGLDTRPIPLSSPRTGAWLAAAGSDACATCLTPNQSAKAFDVSELHDRGVLGDGEYVAVIMDGDVSTDDLHPWETATGLTGVSDPVPIPVDGGPSVSERTSDAAVTEATTDVEQVLGVAPHAHVLYFSTPGVLGGFGDAINAIIKDGRARIVTFSAGFCDADVVSDAEARVARAAEQQALESAMAVGINVFAASGDDGAYTCKAFDPTDWRLTTGWPDDSPYVISVGGTFLDRAPDGSYVGEAAWGAPADNSGSGGGLNPIDPRPAWQQGPGVQNPYSNGMRQVPDVAAPADPVSGWYIFVQGHARSIGGTSASSPFWAGLTALFQQMAQQSGAGSLGFLDPVLYTLAATNPPNTLFHDVTRGNDLYYNATPGWDYATGLGTPIAAALGAAIVTYVQKHPAHI